MSQNRNKVSSNPKKYIPNPVLSIQTHFSSVSRWTLNFQNHISYFKFLEHSIIWKIVNSEAKPRLVYFNKRVVLWVLLHTFNKGKEIRMINSRFINYKLSDCFEVSRYRDRKEAVLPFSSFRQLNDLKPTNLLSEKSNCIQA